MKSALEKSFLLTLILLSSLFVASCNNSSDENNAIRMKTAAIINEDEEWPWSHIVVFDRSGNIAHRYDYHTFLEEWEYEYDSKGNILMMSCRHDNGVITKQAKFEYHDNGDAVASVTYTPITPEIITDEVWKTTFQYDEEWNLIEQSNFNTEGSLLRTDVYNYDSNGNVVDTTRFGGSGQISYKDTFDYDGNGNVITQSHYDHFIDPPYVSRIIKYDNEGNEIEKVSYSHSQSGPAISVTVSYTYTKYDEHGNWTERHVLRTDEYGSKQDTDSRITDYYH